MSKPSRRAQELAALARNAVADVLMPQLGNDRSLVEITEAVEVAVRIIVREQERRQRDEVRP